MWTWAQARTDWRFPVEKMAGTGGAGWRCAGREGARPWAGRWRAACHDAQTAPDRGRSRPQTGRSSRTTRPTPPDPRSIRCGAPARWPPWPQNRASRPGAVLPPVLTLGLRPPQPKWQRQQWKWEYYPSIHTHTHTHPHTHTTHCYYYLFILFLPFVVTCAQVDERRKQMEHACEDP